MVLKIDNSYIKTAVIITAMAAISSELLNSLSTHILIPLIDSDCDKDGKPDLRKNLRNKTIIFKNKIIYSGEFAFTFLKFILILTFLIVIINLI